MPATALTVIAPAKVNLYLHITGRRDDGYHQLDSLVVFADVADQITITPATKFSLAIEGQYATAFTTPDRDDTPAGKNLAVRAAYACATHFNKSLSFRITLAKNLPIASGIGGGSADAAAVIWGLIRFWGLTPPPFANMLPLFLGLGADVPVCYLCQGAHISGIGEKITPQDDLPELAAVLVNPRQSCPTPEIFRAYKESGQSFSQPIDPKQDKNDFLGFLKQQRNDLEFSAIEKLPIIRDVIVNLRATDNVQLVRMSGSGATVFALYPNLETAQIAAEIIQSHQPLWWVRACTLNQVVRY